MSGTDIITGTVMDPTATGDGTGGIIDAEEDTVWVFFRG